MPVFAATLPAPEPTPELLALRRLRVALQRLLEEPGHITKGEVRDLLAAADTTTEGATS